MGNKGNGRSFQVESEDYLLQNHSEEIVPTKKCSFQLGYIGEGQKKLYRKHSRHCLCKIQTVDFGLGHFHVMSLLPCWRAKTISPLGNKIFFHAKSVSLFQPSNMAAMKTLCIFYLSVTQLYVLLLYTCTCMFTVHIYKYGGTFLSNHLS